MSTTTPQPGRETGSAVTTTEPTAHLTPAQDPRDPADRTVILSVAVPPLHARVPRWVITSGMTGWLLLGLAGVVAVILWIMAYVSALVIPFLAGVVLAILFSPIVDILERRRVPRIVGATAVLLGLLAFTVAFIWAIAKGIIDQGPQIAAELRAARESLTGFLTDLGLSPPLARDAASATSEAMSSTTSALLTGIFSGLRGLSSALFMVFIGSVIFLFMLLNGALRSLDRWP
jgi:predicted PurR-regulated permease PerM